MIHILPTDKPSRLVLDANNTLVLAWNKSIEENAKYKKNIYITSDEEIKDGWVWHLGRGHLLKVGQFTEINGNKGFRDAQFNINSIEVLVRDCRKVVLTTDQDLIKDGVQEIDDKFLEWFVKNPSCEEVELKGINFVDSKIGIIKNHRYKIIIPKEDLGYTTKSGIKVSDEMVRATMIPKEYFGKEEPKQETLEEAAERLAKHFNIDFIEGAKWNQERSYSEEEVKNIVDETIEKFYKHFYTLTKAEMKEQWFKQFKKK